MIEKIISLLEQLEEAYIQIYTLSEQKKECIIGNKPDKLNDLTKKEWEVMNTITQLEEERSKVARQLFPEKTTHITLRELLTLSSQEEEKKLVTIADRLKSLLDKQKKINIENQSLIDLHLEYTDYMIHTVFKEPETSSIYGNSGTVQETETDSRNILDSEA